MTAEAIRKAPSEEPATQPQGDGSEARGGRNRPGQGQGKQGQGKQGQGKPGQRKPGQGGPRKLPGPSVQERAARAKEIKRERVRRLGRRISIGVLLPTLISAVYFGFIATPQFESVSIFTINSSENNAAPSLSLFLGSLPDTNSVRDALLAREYILSRDMLAYLAEEHQFLEHYRQADIDWFSRLGDDESSEDIYEYYLDHVTIRHDAETSAIELRVLAFDTETARRFSFALLEKTEDAVNRLSEEARQDSIRFTQEEVSAAEDRLTAARRALIDLQQEGEVFNPEQAAGAVLEVRSGLEGELARARAELSALRSSMQPTAPRVVAQRQRVSALAAQVARQNRRLVDDESEAVNDTIARFEPAVLEKEFAEQAYQSALASLEVARIEANRKHRYLVRIAEPSAPDEYTHPSILMGILGVLVLSFGLLGVGSLLLAVLREHANI